jgi:antitoxin (DNA-binding transcriptional repressor) of toxin-antitoxin stability system
MNKRILRRSVMQQVNVGDATKQLLDLIDAAVRGEVVLITADDRRIVQLVPVKHAKQPRRAGSAKGMIHMADDFDAPLEDFQDYTA